MDGSKQEDTREGEREPVTADEFLVRLGVKKEEDVIVWNPKVKNEPLVRSQSFVCADYTKAACYRRKPKVVSATAWECDSQALRQLSLLPRLGPKAFYFNNQNIHNIGQSYLRGETTQTLGLCCTPRTVDSL